MGFDFDWQNFGVGYGAGLATAYALYRSRGIFRSLQRGFSSQADSAQSFATMGGDRRYSNELTKYAMKSHLLHERVDLSDILIEPRFIPSREIASLQEEEDVRNPFEFVPIVPDHPYLHQPYNINTVNIEELGYGDRALALLGLPGSGRTTALLAIALWSMDKIEFGLPHDPVKDRLQNEENEMSRKERDERAKARVAIQSRAVEQLREEIGFDYGEENASAFIPPFRQMAPFYVHLANVRLGNRDWRGSVDPAEPLIRALQYQTGNVTSKTMPRKVYRFLNEGVALVLLDGLDELSAIEQRQKTAWLEAFLDQYNKNFVIASGPACGYGHLQQIGFTPVHLRPWSYQNSKTYVEKINSNWSGIVDKRRATVDETLREEILPTMRGLNPHEITVKLWNQFHEESPDLESHDFSTWTGQFLSAQFDSAGDALPMMSRAASLQLDHHFFTLNQWVELEQTQGTSTPAPQSRAKSRIEEVAAEFDDDLDDAFGDEDEDEEDFAEFENAELAAYTVTPEFAEEEKLDEEPASEEEKKDESKEARQVRRTVSKLLSELLKAGLLERYQGNRYRFRHAHIASYLGSLSLEHVPEDAVIEKSHHPAWTLSIGYLSRLRPINQVVEAKMAQAGDILRSNLLDIATWLRYADDLAEWRKGFLNYMGKMFVSPAQYLTTRERITAALVTSRDEGIENIFSRGTQSDNTDIRRLAVLGLGTLQDESNIGNLSYFLTDNTDEVKVAAALAISNMHSEEAFTILSETLFDTHAESMQQVIAESFADMPDDGFPLLWELVNNAEYADKIRVRRAAVFGLKRMRTDWSLIDIYRVYLDETQWYVKSAAQSAFTERQSRRGKGIQSYPEITALPWLRDWSLSLEDESATEASGIQLLTRAMQESDPVIRYLATTTSGQLGILENIREIYNALYDQEEAIRDTAYRALADIQLQLGERLPSPI